MRGPSWGLCREKGAEALVSHGWKRVMGLCEGRVRGKVVWGRGEGTVCWVLERM